MLCIFSTQKDASRKRPALQLARRQVIWSQCSDPLLGRNEVTRTNRGAEGIGGRVKFLPLAWAGMPKTSFRKNSDSPSNKVMDKAKELGIHLLFLPPYSPKLNLIERLWKFTKKKCLYNKYYESFHNFKEAINDCLNN